MKTFLPILGGCLCALAPAAAVAATLTGVPMQGGMVMPMVAYQAEHGHLRVMANATNRFTITGMHCNGCAQGLTSELKRARGVVSASVSFTNRVAVVAFDTNRTTTAALVKAIEEAGFKARKLKP